MCSCKQMLWYYSNCSVDYKELHCAMSFFMTHSTISELFVSWVMSSVTWYFFFLNKQKKRTKSFPYFEKYGLMQGFSHLPSITHTSCMSVPPPLLLSLAVFFPAMTKGYFFIYFYTRIQKTNSNSTFFFVSHHWFVPVSWLKHCLTELQLNPNFYHISLAQISQKKWSGFHRSGSPHAVHRTLNNCSDHKKPPASIVHVFHHS